jgi:predicted ATPase/signal transduction histidine kinase
MIRLPGYQVISEIYSSDRTQVYRAAQELDGTRVILKYLANEYPSFTELVQFRHQYTLIDNLKIAGIVQPISLENYGNGYVLVMEDFGGISLRDYTQNQPLSIGEFLPIALQLVQTLNQLLQSRIIHKDIKPDNILINPESKQVKLIDFSIASVLPRETQEIFSPNVLEGTLAYISPEQTGRMNRGIDYRTDFYSLGVTFYELLTGQLPFTATDPMELIHCHIAKPPVSPKTLNPEIPDVLAEIILKLMAKTAEDRYQSAIGIWHDLNNCLKQYTATGTIASFILAQKDVAERFMIPEKLYGRETEVQMLLDAFNQVANPAQPSLTQTGQRGVKLMLVTGFSGIGKSALVHEIHKPIIRQRGYFISGKYDQFQRDIPLSAIVRAFADLIRQLLTESEASVQQWQAKILQALGKNAQVIIDVIPELELLIGSQPPVEKLSGKAAKHRFNLLFQKFIQVFAAPEHPLVVFLDDLQWADSTSLKLMHNLLGENEVNYLLLIGAYRDNEVFPAHPLMLMLQSLPNAEQSVAKITLKPLDFNSLNRLMADTLKCEPSVARPLTELVESKTQGNPFFTIQFLKFLHQIDLISYVRKSNDSANDSADARVDAPGGGYWQCDLTQIKALAISNDVVEFMASQLIKLPEATQNMLKLAACIDNQFDLQTLAIVSEKSLGETASALWPALQEGLILPTSQAYKFFQDASLEYPAKIQDLSLSYKFLHDRVQQSAYALIGDETRKATHLKIGQSLWQHTSDKKQASKIFDIVNQLNYGIELLPSQEERYQLAELNLTAGKKAKASMAYASALKYLNTGVSLLAPESWHECYDLTVNLYLELAETEYFNTNYERCEALGQVILSQADNLLVRIKVYELKIQIATAKNQLQEAVNIGLNVLKSLDITLVDTPPTGEIVKDLHNLPKMTDPVKLAALRILIMIAPATYNGNPELVSLVTLTMVNICIQGGNSPWSAYAYAFYGVLLCSQMEEIETGYEFGQQALQVLEQFEDLEIKGKVYHLFNAGIRHWRESARDTIAPWLDTIQFALDAGDIEYACYAAMGYCIGIFLVGEPLDSVVAKQATYLKLMQKFKQEFPYNGTCLWGQMVLNLARLNEPSNDPTCLIGELANEVTTVPILRENNNIQTLFVVYLGKTFLSYLFKDYEAAVANAAIASEYQQAMGGLLAIAQYPFYESLALLACYPQMDLSQQSAYLEKVAANQETMKIWATNAPMNFQHKYDLVEAEKARILGDNWLATELYEQAIQGAKNAGYIQEEALANELAAEFYLACGRTKVAQTYLIDAYYAYARWGAKTKVDHLRECHRELLSPVFSNQTMEISTTTTVSSSSQSNLSVSQSMSSTGNSSVLDLLSAMKASQALSGEIYLDRLLAKLMQICQENAGAQKCAIILPENDWAIATLSVLDPLSDPEIPPQLNWMNLGESREIPLTVIRYVQRTEETLILADATLDPTFAADPYITEQKPKSILCMPFRNRGQIVGFLYLENQAIAKAFSRDRLEILQLFTAQAAISLENAKLYNSLEQQVQERTQELNEKNLRLKQAIQELKRTQSQMIYTEKMSSLGQIVAGIAHEINNPVSFIYGNIDHTCEYVENLMNLLNLYQSKYPDPDPEIQEEIEAIDLEFLQEDLEKILNSMKNGAQRISHIVKSLRNFSRLDEAEMKPVDIHDGLESTLTLLKSRWQGSENSPEIQVIKKYGKLPKVTCYASAINQVFMNILNNAFDVLSQPIAGEPNSPNEGADLSPPMIQISTELTNNYSVKIHISDNGPGINAKIQKKIFDPFFTTKPVGSVTGLGLSISYQVVVEKHRGKLSCISQPGKGAEFIIEIPVQPTAIADSKDDIEASLMP